MRAPYCADCGNDIEIFMNGLDEPIAATCGCSDWTESQRLPDWWCVSREQANALGVTL